MYGLLDGVRVVDLTTVVLGPLATVILGDLGADIIKVEPPGGDLFRASSPSRNPGMGAPFMNVNRNKRSIVLDLKHSHGHGVLSRLAAGADVFVHNMRPKAVAKLGLGAEAMREINPRLIHCTAIGYGSAGPYADEPAYDDVLQARMGLAALLADEDGTPRLAPTIIADKVTGLYLTHAVLAALYARERTGEGATVEVPMFEALSSFVLAEHMGGRMFDPPLGEPGYNRLLNPYRQPQPTADGHIVVLPSSTRHWRAVFELLGRDDWLAEDWISDPEQRTRRVHELYRSLGEVTPGRTTAEWIEAFQSIDVPCSAVNTLSDLFDDHLAAVDFFESVDHPTEGRLVAPRHPVRYDRPVGPDRPAPQLGADTDEILIEAGFSTGEIMALRAHAVVS